MKANYLLSLLVIFGIIVFGCTQSTAPSNNAMIEKDKMMEKEAGEMAEIGFEMMNGKMMMVDEKTKVQTAMEKEAVLNDGTKVMTNGKVVKKDGASFMLKENESIWMDGTFMKAGEMMEKNEGAMMKSYSGKVLAGASSKYLDFNKEDYDKALKEKKKILLYFYANWCPICKKEQIDTFAAFNEVNDPDLIGFRVNYRDGDDDEYEKALAKEFGVSYQHTKIILRNGQRVLKAPDSWSKQRYLDELKKI
ncbi:thioredoxin family protein [Candidatus Woesearchaeota archaeon]|nr:thioredoxin family protein [Candidatus Woesearchaeota archaeon]